ncbi:MAG: glycosyltransferase [Kiritimatiellae bacterium]|nr:glycosyltransferase [Kiritimatiellia bacterium]
MTIELSIIIPTYLREQVLVATCQSVLAAMDPSHMECWVIDDSPTHEPDVEAWLQRQADLGAIHWVRERTGSLTAARNVALLRARGEVALYLDDDVLIPPGLFERHIRWYADPSVAAVTGEVFNCKNPDQPPPMSDPGRNTFRHVGRDEGDVRPQYQRGQP